MSYDPKNYPKSQRDAFEAALAEHDITLEELIAATKNGHFAVPFRVGAPNKYWSLICPTS